MQLSCLEAFDPKTPAIQVLCAMGWQLQERGLSLRLVMDNALCDLKHGLVHQRLPGNISSLFRSKQAEKAIQSPFDSPVTPCYKKGNTPATPLFPLFWEMMRNNGGFFIVQRLGGYR